MYNKNRRATKYEHEADYEYNKTKIKPNRKNKIYYELETNRLKYDNRITNI
jgi:hypothetical protein